MAHKKIKQYAGPGRFTYFLDQLQQLLGKASRQKNPALWLYRNNARTPLFMLEALAKMYAGLHNKNKFTKLKEQFKLLEDALGAIDYYDTFSKEFSTNKKIPVAITAYLQAQTREKIQSLNELLKEKEWFGIKNNRVDKIRKKLKGTGWIEEVKEIEQIRKFYAVAISGIDEFTREEDFHFTNVEADVHELRRKLRWLSIYPQALRGSIQLSKVKNTAKHLTKYLVKEIISSPFNKMPDAGINKHFLLLDQNYFYALSWMIAELGKLKDNGLRIIAIKEALQQTSSASDTEAYKKAYQYTGPKQLHIPQVLDKADGICKVYFREKNLEYMVIGTGAVK